MLLFSEGDETDHPILKKEMGWYNMVLIAYNSLDNHCRYFHVIHVEPPVAPFSVALIRVKTEHG